MQGARSAASCKFNAATVYQVHGRLAMCCLLCVHSIVSFTPSQRPVSTQFKTNLESTTVFETCATAIHSGTRTVVSLANCKASYGHNPRTCRPIRSIAISRRRCPFVRLQNALAHKLAHQTHWLFSSVEFISPQSGSRKKQNRNRTQLNLTGQNKNN